MKRYKVVIKVTDENELFQYLEEDGNFDTLTGSAASRLIYGRLSDAAGVEIEFVRDISRTLRENVVGAKKG